LRFQALAAVIFRRRGGICWIGFTGGGFLRRCDRFQRQHAFSNDTFGGLIYSEVLEHSFNPEEVIREMRRVARDGALVFISSPFVFPEHGIPLDFQRFTRYFYHACFIQDEIVVISGSNSSFSTPLISANLVFDSTALRRLWGIKHIFCLVNNLLAIILD